MTPNRILVALTALLVALCSQDARLVRGDESGGCVATAQGECMNPDAVVQEDAVQDEVVTEAAETTAEEIAEVSAGEAEAHIVDESAATEEPPATEEDAAEATDRRVEEEGQPEPFEDQGAGEVDSDQASAAGEPEQTEAEPESRAEEKVDDEPIREEESVQETPEAEKAEEIAIESDEVEHTDEPEAKESVSTSESTVNIGEDKKEEDTPGCPARSFVISCAAQYLDTNKNNYLERSEVQAAVDALPWLSRGILSFLGSVDKMMAKCDVDGDGAIGLGYDMTHNSETCLASCFKRRAFKAAFFPECKA